MRIYRVRVRIYRVIHRGYMGLSWDNGKENGNCYLGFRVWVWGIQLNLGFESTLGPSTWGFHLFNG